VIVADFGSVMLAIRTRVSRERRRMERSVMRMNDMTLTLDTVGFAVGAAGTLSRPAGGGIAGMNQQRDRVAVAGGAR